MLYFCFFLLVFGSFSYSGSPAPESRVVAVGDVHGAFDAFVEILQRVKIIDVNRKWSGGNSIFIQDGDVLDRGPKARMAMDLLMSLEKQAQNKGGRVVAILGNHEVMNLIGDLRYVPREEYANYADAQSEKVQSDAYKAFQGFQQKQAKNLKQPEPVFNAQTEQEWKQNHPPGFVEQRQAFSAEGKYGRWLRKHPAVLQINDTIFLHGGISLAVSTLSVEEINKRVMQEIRVYDLARELLQRRNAILPFFNLDETLTAAKREVDKFGNNPGEEEQQEQTVLKELLNVGNWLSMNADGPLWFRGYANWSDEEGAPNIARLLQIYKVNHFVVAHTVQPEGKMRSRFNNEVFLIDTGMNSVFFQGGRASALEMQNRKFTAVYSTEVTPF